MKYLGIFRLLILLKSTLCFVVLYGTEGLLYKIYSGGFGYVKDLHSSGAEDNWSFFFAGTLYAFYFLLVILKAWSFRFICISFFFINILEIFVWSFIQAGDIIFTTQVSNNLYLLFILIFSVLLWILLFYKGIMLLLKRYKYLPIFKP